MLANALERERSARQQRRDQTRAEARNSQNHREQVALKLAEMGYGAAEVAVRAGVPVSYAFLLVTGENRR